jgi:predicted regulator of amino acid metabolism with ACT domain
MMVGNKIGYKIRQITMKKNRNIIATTLNAIFNDNISILRIPTTGTNGSTSNTVVVVVDDDDDDDDDGDGGVV